jgi:uncharacterized protein
MNQTAPAAYFFDTSALIPRYLRRAPGYVWVNEICAPGQGNDLAIAEITEVELTSSFHQLTRGGALKAKRRDATLEVFWNQVDSGGYTIIPVTSAIVRSAADLCRRHPLKGYDAMQLACAITLREDLQTVRTALGTLVCLSEDKRLLQAAEAEGFTVDNPAAH